MGLLLDTSTDKHEFLDKIKFLNMVFIDLYMWMVFETSLGYMSKSDHFTYEFFLLDPKLFLEKVQKNKSRKFKDFEIIRLEKSNDLDTVVLEGYCSSCKEFCVVPLKTTDYLGKYIKSYVSKKYLSNILCLKCNKEYLHFEQIVDSQSVLRYFDDTILNTNQTNEENLIEKIFEFGEKENIFTKKAQQYQWIIQSLNDNILHKITDAQEWVLSKVPQLFNVDISKTPSENKKSTNSLFNRYINNLEEWDHQI